MELAKKDLVKAAGAIINKAGIDGLTIVSLAVKLGISPKELSSFFTQDKDVLLMMLLSLDNEIQQLIHNVVTKTQLPEEELNSLFKNLYTFFDQKPYYLPVIFAAELMENDSDIQDILLRIKTAAEIYLFEIINQGKQKKLFNNATRTKSIFNRILVSFRVLMNEKQISIKLVRDLEIQRGINE